MSRKLARKLQAVNEVLRITKKKLDGFNSRPMVSELDGGRVKDTVSLRLIALSNRFKSKCVDEVDRLEYLLRPKPQRMSKEEKQALARRLDEGARLLEEKKKRKQEEEEEKKVKEAQESKKRKQREDEEEEREEQGSDACLVKKRRYFKRGCRYQ
ncbi:hypothetical protein G6F18_012503 [Rhizopus arrhizus]|nr:hypothetical protein G6F20_012492 [Rhizopus arrhizus]KAG1256308.1 hypothetical protein G6F68_009841 [Rhizopus microsporus]KAG0820719.1 hypothetical protein G6F18_012503 [Rhizopus arrhizus]KAG0866315.1 hypothetical protein G6F15_012698 [Rhizopus arrhizus]KAG1088341.1 hypothetical protein G6F40_013520 [Rhizopus arrhizus]